MKAGVADIFAAVFLLAMVMLLVRPNSLAPAFIREFGSAMDLIVSLAVSG